MNDEFDISEVVKKLEKALNEFCDAFLRVFVPPFLEVIEKLNIWYLYLPESIKIKLSRDGILLYHAIFGHGLMPKVPQGEEKHEFSQN